MNALAFKHIRPCRLWHRWNSIEDAEWVGGIAYPAFRHTCRRCGAKQIRRVMP